MEDAGGQHRIRPALLDAVAWASEMARRGAGEILLTSMDRDGTKAGFDLDLTRAVSDAVLAASIFHYGEYTVGQAKQRMAERGIPVRI